MAEEKETSSKLERWFWELMIIIVILLALPAFFVDKGLLEVDAPTGSNVSTKDNSFFSISKIIGTGDLKLGENITVLKELKVRNAPGGRILGLQKRLTDGRIMEGPIEQFGTTWWRVNFENAPSGWVEHDQITTRSGIVKTIYFPETFLKAYKPIGWVLSILFLIIFFIIKLKLMHEVQIERKKLSVQDEQAEKTKEKIVSDSRDDLGLPSEAFKNERWEHVKELMKSKVQSDWRQAIIEADIILDEMLRRMSYDGLTIGDMLKQVDPADFANLQKAWDAHKFRNEIAHTGSEFKISKEEADRVISLYQAVFDEFYYI